MAGPIDTAIRSGKSLAWAFTFGGTEDRALVNKLRGWGQIDRRTMGKIIEQTALVLFTVPGPRAVERTVNLLQYFGRVTG